MVTGTSPHGQGHETSFAQIASAILGIPMDRIRVVHSDTGVVPSGEGTYGSRSLQIGGSAVWNASQDVLEKAKRVAAHLLEVAEADLVHHDDGRIGVAGAPLVDLEADPALGIGRRLELVSVGIVLMGVAVQRDRHAPRGNQLVQP